MQALLDTDVDQASIQRYQNVSRK